MAKKKFAANPIPERKYEQFKNRLEEISKDSLAPRNVMLFILDVATGYRLQDLVDLTIAQIKEALFDGEFVIQEKKQYNTWKAHMKKYPNSKKEKPLPRRHTIEPPLEKYLKSYIKGKNKSEYAFPSQKGTEHIKQKSFSEIMSKVGKEFGLKHISGHSLRKTYAHRLYEETKDIEYVRIALNHSNIETTKRYLGLEEQVKVDAAKIAAKRL